MLTDLQNSLLCAVIFLFMLYPRFKKWPEKELGRLAGEPRDYINRQRYYLFAAFYLATFVLFAIAVRSISNIEDFVKNLPIDQGLKELIEKLSRIPGDHTFAQGLVIVALALMIPQVESIEQRWRAMLFQMARVPKEAQDLKGDLLERLSSCKAADRLSAKMRDSLAGILALLRSAAAGEPRDLALRIAAKIIDAAYLIDLNRALDPTPLETNTLNDVDKRLIEMGAVLKGAATHRDESIIAPYGKEIDDITDTLAEVLARSVVRECPDEQRRHAMLARWGFDLPFTDRGGFDIVRAVVLCGIAVPCATFLTIWLSFTAFDALGVRTTNISTWLTSDKLMKWTLGGALSYLAATCCGVFFNEVTRRESSRIPVYLQAFMLATLSSGCIFFMITGLPVHHLSPYIMLSISFGMMSVVAVVARNHDVVDSSDVLGTAVRISLAFGVIAALAQVAVLAAFNGWDQVVNPPLNGLGFFVYGLVRGGFVAFIVAFALLEGARLQSMKSVSRRRHPRLPLRETFGATLAGQPVHLLVKDLSLGGAKLRLPQQARVAIGDDLRLQFDFGELAARVLWLGHRNARVSFDASASELSKLEEFIRSRMGAPHGAWSFGY